MKCDTWMYYLIWNEQLNIISVVVLHSPSFLAITTFHCFHNSKPSSVTIGAIDNWIQFFPQEYECYPNSNESISKERKSVKTKKVQIQFVMDGEDPTPYKK
jgi:hypothetical protein